jgi:hypothetical protein
MLEAPAEVHSPLCLTDRRYLGKETVDAGTFANMDATYMSAIGHQASLPLALRGGASPYGFTLCSPYSGSLMTTIKHLKN